MSDMPDTKLIGAVAQHVQLVAVNCRDFSARRMLDLDTFGKKDVRFKTNHSADGLRDLEASQIVVVAKFEFRCDALETGQEEACVAQMSATLSLRYDVAKEELDKITPEAVQAFARFNGMFNAYPYWRELLQSSMGRLGLPGVTAPVYRIPRPAPRPKEPADK